MTDNTPTPTRPLTDRIEAAEAQITRIEAKVAEIRRRMDAHRAVCPGELAASGAEVAE